MIRKSSRIIGMLALGAVIFSGCTLSKMLKMAQDQELTVTPKPLELHGDSVEFEVSAILPTKMLKKNHVYNAEMIYKYGDNSEKLGMMQFRYEDFADNPEEQPMLKKTFSFKYDTEMKRGTLYMLGSAAKVTGKSKSAPEFPIAEGVITTSKLVKDENYVAYAHHGYNNQEELIPTNVEFFFRQGSDRLRYSEMKGDDGQKMVAYIAEKNLTRKVNLTGMHSPEGDEEINTALAKGRPSAVESYYRRMMKRYDYKDMADSIAFNTDPIVFNWGAFRKAVEASDLLSEDQKSEIYGKISGSGSFVEQEKSLRELPYYNSILMAKIYPPLRTAKTEMLSVKPKKTDAEIATLAKKLVNEEEMEDSLNAKELGYAATLTPELEEKEKIYEALVKETEGAVAYNNLGAVYLEMAKKAADKMARGKMLDKAKASLDIAIKKEGLAESYNNLAVVFTMKGDKKNAYDNYQKAIDKGASGEIMKGIRSNIGAAHIKYANYDKAVKSLGSSSLTETSMFNMGLAQLLKNDYQPAKNNLSKIKGDAVAAYCSAIVAARMGNSEEMVTNLKEAIKLDSTLRERAIKDLEFKKYFDTPGFKNAVK